MSYVGKVRVNQAVSDSIKTRFSRFLAKPGFDVIEVFDASFPNDPSPPSKAAALLHRQTGERGRSTFRVLDSVVLDYNNRDFHESQIWRIVNRIGSDWLAENSGGILYNVHRPNSKLIDNTFTASCNRFLNQNRNKTDPASIEIFAKSKNFGGFKLDSVWNQFNYFSSLKKLPPQTGRSASVRVLMKNRFTVYACVDSPIDDSICKSDFAHAMHALMKSERCIEGVLYFNVMPSVERNFYSSFTVHTLRINSDDLPVALSLSADFIRI